MLDLRLEGTQRAILTVKAASVIDCCDLNKSRVNCVLCYAFHVMIAFHVKIASHVMIDSLYVTYFFCLVFSQLYIFYGLAVCLNIFLTHVFNHPFPSSF